MMFFKKKKEPNFEDFPPIGGLMVSKMITEENLKPMFMYREKRTRPEDSGWRIFSGYEPEDYTDNPDNSGIYNPSTILKIDPTIADLLLKGIGSVYERESEKKSWYKVTDFELEDDYMVTHKLTDKWAIEINNLFERRVEESGSLLYTTGDKSVRLTTWEDKDKSKQKIYEEFKTRIETRDQSKTKTLQKFEFSDNKVLRTGYLVSETDGQKKYSVIYGSCIIDDEILQAAFYFDDSGDADWAVETWKGIRVV